MERRSQQQRTTTQIIDLRDKVARPLFIPFKSHTTTLRKKIKNSLSGYLWRLLKWRHYFFCFVSTNNTRDPFPSFYPLRQRNKKPASRIGSFCQVRAAMTIRCYYVQHHSPSALVANDFFSRFRIHDAFMMPCALSILLSIKLKSFQTPR